MPSPRPQAPAAPAPARGRAPESSAPTLAFDPAAPAGTEGAAHPQRAPRAAPANHEVPANLEAPANPEVPANPEAPANPEVPALAFAPAAPAGAEGAAHPQRAPRAAPVNAEAPSQTAAPRPGRAPAGGADPVEAGAALAAGWGLSEAGLAARLARSPWAGVPLARFFELSWQHEHRIQRPEQLAAWLKLTPEERRGFWVAAQDLPFATLPYFALLADPDDPACPIRRQLVPSPAEAARLPGQLLDPLGEAPREVAPQLIHRYPDRALLLVTDRCEMYCRFCTRRRLVGRTERPTHRRVLAQALDYVRATPALRELILSGGDAFSLGDDALDRLLGDIRAIPHIERVRIATRTPATAPMRVSERLAKILRRHAPLFVLTHFNHPRECTAWAAQACGRLVDAGVPVHNQTVLLAGVNDRPATIAELNRRLVNMRVHPYYLHQCDLAEGVEHFRTPLATGLGIIEALRGHHSGLMMPQLCVDVPGGLGKVTLLPEWIVGREGDHTVFRTYTGQLGRYPEPAAAAPAPGRSQPAAGADLSVDSPIHRP